MLELKDDDRGTAEYNLALAAKRAQTAKDYLTTLGVSIWRADRGDQLRQRADRLS